MSLLDELRSEHKQIVGGFDSLDKTKDTKEIQALTSKLLEIIVPHVKKENEQLYPVLQKAASEEIRQTAAIFSGLMIKYSVELMNMIQVVLDQQGELSQNVLDEYYKIRGKIRDRVSIEETILFPAYCEVTK